MGDKEVACDLKLLKSINITHILVCGREFECFYPNQFKYKKLDL